MPDVTATDAARKFADLLDAVEHRGEHFTIVRRGKAIAHLEPTSRGRGADTKALLQRHRPDPAWTRDLGAVRALLEVDEPSVSQLLFDTTFLIDAERGGSDLDGLVDDDDDVAIAAITVAELRVGALLADKRRRATRSAYVDDVTSTLPVLDYDLDVAEAHAVLLAAVREQARPRGAHDLLIAATARAAGRIVITADADAFIDLPGVAVRTH